MFSGIVEEFATVRKLVREQGNLHLTLTCSFVGELKIDQSVAHNGVCLTVVDITGDEYTVDGLHPNDNGYELLANIVCDYLARK